MSIKYAFPLKIPDNSPDNFIMFSHAAKVYILIVNTQRFLYAYLLSALPCAGACGPCRPCVPPSGGRLFRCGVPEHALGCISACGAFTVFEAASDQPRLLVLLLIILRLIPAVPYNLINYAFGLTEMPFAAYMLGSAIGIIPGTLVFINIGDKALDVTSPSFWIALGLLVLLLAVTAFMSKKLFPNNDKDTNGEVTEYGKDK